MEAPQPNATRDILQGLTTSQREAVEHVEGPLLMLAGPGSGKTRVVTHRIAYLLQQGVPAWQILALTFTNKAADEMNSRLQRLAPNEKVWMGTFHRFCARLLRQHAAMVGLSENFSIYDSEDSRKALREACQEHEVDLLHYNHDSILRAISTAKSSLITAENYQPRSGDPLGVLVAQVYPLYQKRLLDSNAVDFDNLLLHVGCMLRESPELRASLDERYHYILVDEYQDTNLAQYAIVRAISVIYPNLAVTGDPDQSIYEWRGASLENILGFERDYPKVRVIRLEQNYRSTKNILRVADQLISRNRRRKEKKLFTDNDTGAPVQLITYGSYRDESDQIASQIASQVAQGRRRPSDFAIFYRVNSLSRSLEHALSQQGVPYQIVSGLEFYKRKEIKDILAYLQTINNPRDDIALKRVINTPTRGIGKTTIERLTEHARRYGISLLEAARESGMIEKLNKRAAVAVAKFVSLFDRLVLVATGPLEELLGHVLTETSYRTLLELSDTPEDHQRLENIDELLADAREFDERNPEESSLEAFLEQTVLVNDADGWESESDRVSLMTLHAAKGLEFPVVFLVALEEGILPHERSREDANRLEEERRLLFVGITRAKEELQLSMSAYRNQRGGLWPTVPSQFLVELPRQEMTIIEPTSSFSFDADNLPDDESHYMQDYPTPVEEEQAPSLGSKVMTASQLLSDQPTPRPRIRPEAFQQGMIVSHPEHGTGTVVALSGKGIKRVGTVRFFGPAGQKKFRLAHAPLTPVQSSEE